MRIPHILFNFPHITISICAFCQFEVWFTDHVNDFVGWQKIPRIEINTARSVPNNNLTNRESLYNFMPILP